MAAPQTLGRVTARGYPLVVLADSIDEARDLLVADIVKKLRFTRIEAIDLVDDEGWFHDVKKGEVMWP